MGSEFPKPGELFEDRYRIESVIGRGGFAEIYLAEQVDLSRQVALKILNPRLRNDETHGAAVEERFRREAKLVAALRDPHTITMHDYGHTDDGLLYMVFEYIDGLSLSELVREEGPIAPRRVVKILRQCLMSLQEAHALGVLHRDIKPPNIMLYEHVGRPDQVKVLDFGIAKSVLGTDDGATAHDLTQAGMIVGTPRYMAPEQLRGQAMGPSTDLYSLALVVYELLCGHKAIVADSVVNIITEQVSGTPIKLPPALGLPSDFVGVVNTMLAKQPQLRFQSAGEVLEALDRVDESALSETAPDEPIEVPVTGLPAGEALGSVERPVPSGTVTAVRPASARRTFVVAGIAVLAAAAAIAYVVMGGPTFKPSTSNYSASPAPKAAPAAASKGAAPTPTAPSAANASAHEQAAPDEPAAPSEEAAPNKVDAPSLPSADEKAAAEPAPTEAKTTHHDTAAPTKSAAAKPEPAPTKAPAPKPKVTKHTARHDKPAKASKSADVAAKPTTHTDAHRTAAKAKPPKAPKAPEKTKPASTSGGDDNSGSSFPALDGNF